MTVPSTPVARVPYRLLRGKPSPMVTVDLFHDHEQVSPDAYVDSGSYYSIFLADVAEALGIKVDAGRLAYVTSINGQVLPIYLHRVGLRIAGVRLTGEIGFSAHLKIGFNLLGRNSIFNQILFCFDDDAGELLVHRRAGL